MTAPLSFDFPSSLLDLAEDAGDDADAFLRARNPIPVKSLRSADLEELVKGVAFDLSDRELFCVEEQDVFDRVFSLVRDFSFLPPPLKFTFVEALRSNLSVLLPNVDSLSRATESSPSDGASISDRIASHRNALKIYSFFLLSVALAEESAADAVAAPKISAPGRKKMEVYTWNWEVQRERIMNLIANSLEINLSLLFGPAEIDEKYISFVSKVAFVLYENQNLLKHEESRCGIGRIIGTVATKHHRSPQICASLLHLIHKFDFTVQHIAEAVANAEKKYGDGSLMVAIIREIGRTDPKDYARDNVGAENIGRFLVELADKSPKLMSTNVGVLVPHFGGESYKIRNALVGVLGKLVTKAFKDVEGHQRNPQSLLLRGKQAMMEILLERCRDVSAYTRSRVLQVWAELCEENAISIGLWNEVASVASGRLEDKSAMVRKSALHLLITMLQHNPFGPQLRVTAFEATLGKYRDKLDEMDPCCHESNSLEEGALFKESSLLPEESVNNSCLTSGEDNCSQRSQDHKQKDDSIPDIGNMDQIRALVASLEAGLRFSKCITSLMPILIQLLASSTVTDVENTIHLLMRCRQFQIDGSEECLRKMFPLVFSQDKSIYEAVENAFISIYIRKSPMETAQNLLSLAVESSIGDLTALECLISSLVSKGSITSSMISALWDFFGFNVNGAGVVQSRGALSILCMAAKSTPSILSAHLQDIIDIGFGRWAKGDPLLARTACTALERLSSDDKDKLRSTNCKVFGAIQNFISNFLLPDKVWYAAADKAISTLYLIHPTPETVAADIVKKSFNSLFASTGKDSSLDIDEGNLRYSAVAAKLACFLFLISHIALHQLVYIESCVRKIRKQKTKKETSESTDAKTAEEHSINTELGLGASVDLAIDTLAERTEKEIVSSCHEEKNLIGYCGPFLIKLCRNWSLLQKFPELQSSAMLALCRLMIIDADFCEGNLQLLFTVAENSPWDIVRSNCTIALGDLAARFPNLLEPWTEHMYARLRDPSVSVRKNAVLVISHLILNDMMKVKGYINEMTIRIEDEDSRISSLAKLFFHELSKKGNNPIYNLLPDILGRLCSQELNNETFCNIMQFLISSIKKDKQMESLIEKLCNRFSGVNDTRQWEYISYCLSQLTFTEKGLKKLIESLKAYEHVLCEDSVMFHFRSVIAKCKKFAKPDIRTCVDEYEEKLNKIHLERKDQEATTRNAKEHQQRIGSLSAFVVKKKAGRRNGLRPTEEEICKAPEQADEDKENSPEQAEALSEESGIFSSLRDSKEDNEVQSPKTSRRGLSTARTTKNRNLDIHASADTSNLKRKGRSIKR